MTADVRSDYRYAPIPEALLYAVELSPLAVRVYGALARHGMDPSSCYPSHAAIAQLIGCSQRSVQRPLRDLETAGWITRVPRWDDRGDRRSDGFIVRVEPALSCAEDAHEDAPTAQESADPSAQESADPPRTGARYNESHENESHVEREEDIPATARTSARDTAEQLAADIAVGRRYTPPPGVFDAFWESYPIKKSKGAARKAWTQALKRADAESIIAGAVAYRDDPHRDPKFTKHPATWLNADGWLDEPTPAGPNSGPRAPITHDRSAPSGRIDL